MRGQQHSFSTHEWLFLGKCRTPNLPINAECSNLLSYQGQTFAVPWLWWYRYFWNKVNIWNVDRARATAFIFDTQALIWNLKVKFMGVVIGQGITVSPVPNWFTSFLLASIWPTIHDIQLFEIWLWKKQCHIIIIIVIAFIVIVIVLYYY